MITAISSTVNQNVTVNLPGQAEAEQAREDLNATIDTPKESSKIEEKVYSFIGESGGDLNFALARLRMDIERALREALGKRTVTTDPIV